VKADGKSLDFSSKKLVSMSDLRNAQVDGIQQILVGARTIVTPAVRDFAVAHSLELRTNGTGNGHCTDSAAPSIAKDAVARTFGNGAEGRKSPDARLFFTPEAEEIKKEICAVGRKLWMRQFVDGNGGNISYRIGPNEVICTPTLVSKYDLTPADLSLVDLDGNQLAGIKPRTSEILLHLEIYKAVPQAKSVVHCHPPHATAYAITGRVPPNLIIPEFEVFVGKVALSPYETPGTTKFAQTVIPFVKDHNTVLLSNHGIVCWADTVTHAEWYAEVLDTYCWTLMLAAQLGAPISHITEKQESDLLTIKQKLGLPDIRLDASKMKECQLSDMEIPASIALSPNACECRNGRPSEPDLEVLVKSVTDAVMETIAAK
jgi:L-fuculose-phosphate aldolase